MAKRKSNVKCHFTYGFSIFSNNVLCKLLFGSRLRKLCTVPFCKFPIYDHSNPNCIIIMAYVGGDGIWGLPNKISTVYKNFARIDTNLCQIIDEILTNFSTLGGLQLPNPLFPIPMNEFSDREIK